MKFFGDSISGNCLKVKYTADALGLAYEWVPVDIMRGESRTPEFLAMSPMGQVPLALLDDGRPLAQSNAIILHLARGSALIPIDPYLQARMFEWMFWEQYSHEPYVAVARFQVRYRGRNPATLEPELVGRAEAALDRLEAALSGSPWLVGDAFSLADMTLLPYTRFAPEAGLDLSRWQSLTAWIRRSEGVIGLAPLGAS